MERGAYKADKREDIARLELKARRAGVTLNQLAERAGIGIATLRRIRRTGLAFPRQLVALRMALRALEKERKGAGDMFPTGDGAPEAAGVSQSAGRKK